MKKIKFISSLVVVVTTLLIVGCSPIEDRLELSNSITADQVILTATSETPGGNKITVKADMPAGVSGHWVINGEVINERETTFVYPVMGDVVFTYVTSLGAEVIEKPVTIKIEKLVHGASPELAFLTGDNPVVGKTWVLATDRPKDLEFTMLDGTKLKFRGNLGTYVYSGLSHPDPLYWEQLWWNAGKTYTYEPDAEMTFDLNTDFNYTYVDGKGGDPIKGTFVLDLTNDILDINDAKLVGGTIIDSGSSNGLRWEGNDLTGIYNLKVLSENEIIVNQIHGGEGWIWVFKAKGYTYN